MVVDDQWGPVLEQAKLTAKHIRDRHFRWSCECEACGITRNEIRDLLCEVERVDYEIQQRKT